MKIEILRNGGTIAAAEGEKEAYLVFSEEYQEGDALRLTPERSGFITLQLDAVLGRATVYASGCIIAENPQEEFQHDRIS